MCGIGQPPDDISNSIVCVGESLESSDHIILIWDWNLILPTNHARLPQMVPVLTQCYSCGIRIIDKNWLNDPFSICRTEYAVIPGIKLHERLIIIRGIVTTHAMETDNAF